MDIGLRSSAFSLRAIFSGALLICAGYTGVSLAEQPFLPQEVDELRSAAKALAQVQSEADATLKNLAVKKAEMDQLRAEHGRLKRDMEEKKKTLENLQTLDLEHPEYGLGTKVQEARKEYNAAFHKVNEMEQRQKERESDLVSINAQQHKINAEVKHRNGVYLSKRDAIVDRVLDKRVKELKVSKKVTAEAVVACGTESVKICRDRAKKQAQRNASETGSVVLLDSMTQIENFKMSKDEVRSEVSASLSDIKVLDKGWVTDESYRVQISAVVTPAITANLRSEIRQTIQSELNAAVGSYAPVSGFSSSYVPPKDESVDEEEQYKDSVSQQKRRYEEMDDRAQSRQPAHF